MDFNQVHVSSVLEKYFGDGFRKKWNLKNSYDENLPCVFVGLYNGEDIKKFVNHKSYRIVIWGGADMVSSHLNLVAKLINDGRTFTYAYPGYFSNILTKHNLKHKQIYIPFKDYSMFKPTPLGEKIYVYYGIHGNKPDYFNWDTIIKPIIKHFGEENVIYSKYKTIDFLKENFYEKSFVYLKTNEKGGCTTMFELGHMGRKTIGIGHEGLPNFVSYKNINDIINKIEIEKNNIGKIMTDISDKTKKIFTGNEWLNLKFWAK
jgi:hypothetical protein